MIAFIGDNRQDHGVEPICKLLTIAPSTYRLHAAKLADPSKLSLRAKRDLALKIEISRVFEGNFGVYGVRKSLPPRRRGSGGKCSGRALTPPAVPSHG